MNPKLKLALLVVVLAGIAVGIFYFESLKPQAPKSSQVTEKGTSPEIVNPSGFINTDEITLSEFIGEKVILVDFWTYSCINCQRTTPYLNAWWRKYKDQGLMIIGIHTPEFEFEKDIENVRAAVEKFGIEYPVVLDNDYATWTAFGNRYWPHKYLIDQNGNIVYDHIGEGAYEETEKEIQNALGVLDEEMVTPSEVVEVDFSKVESPEVYFGSSRNEFLENGNAFKEGVQSFEEPETLEKNKLYLVGDWDITSEYAQNQTPNAKILFRYEAKNVYLVGSSENGVSIKILKDGELIQELTIQKEELYHLVLDSEYGEHTLEIQIVSPGLNAFTFTFG